MGVQNITIKDETMTGEVKNEFVIKLLLSRVTVADIIKERVTMEVDAYNRRSTRVFSGLVQPTETETTLNGFKFKTKRQINVKKQIDAALRAFESNGFFILIDDLQAENLTDPVKLKPDMTVSFVKLTPLVGG